MPDIGQVSGDARIIEAFQAEALENAQEASIEGQLATKDAAIVEADENPVNLHAKELKAKEPEKSEKAKKAEEVFESILVRKDESEGLADSFNQQKNNQQYHLDKQRLSELALGLKDLAASVKDLEQSLMAAQESSAHINQQINKAIADFIISKYPPSPDSTRETAIHAGQVDKAFEFLTFVLNAKLKAATTPTQREEISRFIGQIQGAKEQFYAENQQAIDDAHKYISLADGMIEETEGRGAAETAIINEKLEEIKDMVHNTPTFIDTFRQYEAKGASPETIERDMRAILHFIGQQFTERSGVNFEESSQNSDYVKSET